MTRNPRSTSMSQVLRYAGISPARGRSSISGNRFLRPKRAKKQSAPGRRSGPMRWGKYCCLLWFLVAAGRFKTPAWPKKASEPVQDLVGPEPLEPVQRLVQGREFLVRDAADLLHGLDVLLVERVNDLADFLALGGEADADRTAIDARALMIEEAEFDQLLQIIGNVGAEVITARAQLARGQFLVADVIEQQGLHRIDVGAAAAIEFILDNVEQPAIQPLHQSQGFDIERLHRSLARSAFSGFHRRCNGFHHDTSPVVVFIDLFDETCVPPDSFNLRGRFEDQLK